MSKRPGDGFLASIADSFLWKRSRPSSPIPSESGEAVEAQHSYPRTEEYGLFIFGDGEPPDKYDIELSISSPCSV